MKKFNLKVDGKEYQVIGESLDTIEMWQDSGMPKIWEENRSSVVSSDFTQEIKDSEDRIKNFQDLKDLLSDPDIAPDLLEKYRAIREEKRRNKGGNS